MIKTRFYMFILPVALLMAFSAQFGHADESSPELPPLPAQASPDPEAVADQGEVEKGGNVDLGEAMDATLPQDKGDEGGQIGETSDPSQVVSKEEVVAVPDGMELVSTQEQLQKGAPGEVGDDLPAAGHALLRTAGLEGGAGPLRLNSAFLTTTGTINLGFWGQYLRKDDMILAGDSVSRAIGNLSITHSPIPYLQANLSIRASGSRSTHTRPEFLQSSGDLSLGLMGAYPVLPGLSWGGGLKLDMLNRMGDVGLSGKATNVWLGTIASLDFSQLQGIDLDIPVVTHANLGFRFDNSAKEMERDLSLPEQFGTGVNHFDMVTLGFGVEVAPIAQVAPFVEWHLHVPVETRTSTYDVCVPNLPCPGDPDIGFGSYPHLLSLGVRGTPYYGVVLSAAVDLGLTSKVATGISPAPPYNLLFGLSYVAEPVPRTQVVTRTITHTMREIEPPHGRLKGVVIDARTNEPIAGAAVSYPENDRSSQLSDGKGQFFSYRLSPGQANIEVGLPGLYKTKTFEVDVPEGEFEFSFPLEMDRVTVPMVGKVTDEQGKPVKGAKVTVLNGRSGDLRVDAGSGNFEGSVPEGPVKVQVIADGFLARERDLAAKRGDRLVLDFSLVKAGKPQVEFKDKKIVLKNPIHFQSGRATIVRDSFHILDQVIDALVRNRVKRLRVEGHTDNRGGVGANLRLSQERAEAVKAYLVDKGISADRIEARGFGQANPIAPNMTAHGRSMNRRVEFLVLD